MTTPKDDAATPARPADPSSPAGDDPAAVFRRALRYLLVMLAVLAAAGAAVGWLVAGWPGVWGAAIGVALTLVFSGTTVWSMLRTAHVHPSTMSAVVMVAWIGKVIVVVVALAALRGLDFYDRQVLGVVLMLGVVGSAVLDYRAVVGTRVPYVQPLAGRDGDGGTPAA